LTISGIHGLGLNQRFCFSGMYVCVCVYFDPVMTNVFICASYALMFTVTVLI